MSVKELQKIAEKVKEVIIATVPNCIEVEKYGGQLYEIEKTDTNEHFCGIFVYKEHVSIEFARGAEMNDKFNVLEGGGKYRRHIKLHLLSDIETKNVRDYIKQSYDLITNY